MILPIVAYGDVVLRKPTEEIDENFPKLKELIANMYETMYNANGVGLAAPQIGESIRVFIIDSTQMYEREGDDANKGIKQTFINPIILEEKGKEWGYEEGCLSIPNIVEEVFRQQQIEIEYYDENFELKTQKFDDLDARVIQHEYDHIEGVLFTDHLKPLRKKLLQSRLKDISVGRVSTKYKMRFPRKK